MTDRDADHRYLTGALTEGDRPAAIGHKFTPEGDPLPTPGNTFICHIDPDSQAFAKFVAAQDRLKAGPVADAFTFLPTRSLHMTIFEGVIEGKRDPERWPEHLEVSASVETVTDDFRKRTAGLTLAPLLCARPTGVMAGFSVSMAGFAEDSEALLRETRDRLATATGIHRPDHASYRFHVTLAYLLRWLTDKEADMVLSLSDEVGKDLIESVPLVELGPVEFCRFETMHHFEPVHLVG